MSAKALFLEYKWLVGGLAVFAYVVKELVSYNRLRHFKGPPGAAISNYWHTKAFISGKCQEYYGEANEEYGPIARIAPNMLVTSSPELWARLNAVRSPYRRSFWFYSAARWEEGKDNVFSQCNDELHDKRRKQMAPGYSGKENFALESAIDTHVTNLLQLIRTHYLNRRQPMDLAEKIQFFTMDVISTVGLGKSFAMLPANHDPHGYLSSLEAGLRVVNTTCALGPSWAWLVRVPVLGPRLLAPGSPAHDGGGGGDGFAKMMATANGFVDDRLASPLGTDEKSDMLASFIRHGLTDDELKTEALEQVLAGSDTTASGIRGILLHLMTSPRVFAKLRAEIDGVVARGEVSSEGIVSVPLAAQMSYLQAVIREGLRVFPPVADFFPRIVPPEGDTVVVDGREVFIPGGVEIGYSAWGMHHDKELYGEDAKAFRPERWIEEKDSEKLARMTKTNEMIFGHGKFQCLGKPVAWIEIQKVVFELVRHFDWTIMNPLDPWKTMNYLGLFAIHDMWVQVTAREQVGMIGFSKPDRRGTKHRPEN